MFITGPKVIETVTGEKISSENLGGARVQEGVSGVHTLRQSLKKTCCETCAAC